MAIKNLLRVMLALCLFSTVMSVAHAGNCNVPSDRASDGSRCGGRSAQDRPGGE